MTQDEIIEMARQVGMYGLVEGGLIKEFEAFAKLVAAKEREACAMVCERKDEAWKRAGLWNQSFEYKECAEAIRARGEAWTS